MKTSTSRSGVAARHVFVSRVAGTAALLVLAGCADVDIHTPEWTWDGDFGEVRNTDQAAEAPFRYEAGTAETLSLTGVAGTVEIVGRSDVSGIVVEGFRRVWSDGEADAEAHLPGLTVEVRESDGTLFVDTRQPARNRGRRYEVDYRISVPTHTEVAVTHVGGPVTIRSLQGDVDVNAVAGRLTLMDLTANVRGTVSSGAVDASVALPPGGLLELRSGVGDIRLRLPVETSASVLASTLSGWVRTEGLALVDDDPRAEVLKATMADGNGTVRLQTTTGNITLEGR